MALGGITNSINFALALATSQFNAGLSSAGASLNGFASGANGKLQSVSVQAGVMGAAMTAAFGVTIAKAMEFEKSMSNVAAVSGATGDQFDRLRTQAIELGEETVFSATEAAKAQEELAKAGIEVNEILGGGLQGTLSLAAATNLDLAAAAEIAANSMNVFGIAGRDVEHVADIIAGAANKSAMTASDFAMAMKQAGAAANLTGMDFEETSAALAIFADSGIKGSDAGTSLRTMLLRLKPTTKAAREEMALHNLEFEDQAGNFKTMSEVAGELREGLRELGVTERTAALNRIFGQDAIRASALLYSAGADGVTKMTAALDEEGYAAEVAAIKMDNLSGDVERLSGAFETMMVSAGSESQGALREIVQQATAMVDTFNELPPAVGGGAVAITGFTGAALLGVSGLGMFIGQAREVKLALSNMGGAAQSFSNQLTMGRFLKIGAGLAGIGVAFAVISSQIQSAKQQGQEMADIFLASLGTPQTLADQWSYASAVVAQHNVYIDKMNDSYDKSKNLLGDDFAKKFERTMERVGITGDDAFSKNEEAAAALREELDGGLGASIVAQEAMMYGLGTSMQMSAADAAALAERLGVDLRGASELAMAGLEEMGAGWDIVDGRFKLTTDGAQGVRDVFTTQLLPSLSAAFHEANSGAPAFTEVAGAMTDLADETSTAADRFEAFEKAVKGALGINQDVGAAHRDLTRQLWDAAEAADKVNEAHWHGFNKNTAEAYKFRDEMDALETQFGETLIAEAKHGASQEKIDALFQQQITSLRQMQAEGRISAEVANEYIARLGNIPPDVSTLVETPGLPEAQTGVVDLQNYINALERNIRMQVLLDTSGARQQLYDLGITVEQAHNSFRNRMRDIGNPNPQVNSYNADGNIYVPFAEGGHMPMVARGGLSRVWNEPETGGESYIPWASSKRPRAVEILRQTNDGFGNPLGAGGGGGDTTVVNVTVQAPNYVGDQRDLIRAVTAPAAVDQITRAIGRGQSARSGART